MDTLTPAGRILMTTDSVGGVWRYAVDTGRELARRGAQVGIVGFGPEPSAEQQEEAAAAGLELFWLEAQLDWTSRGPEDLKVAAAGLDRLIRRFRPTVLHVNSPALAGYLEHAVPSIVAVHSCVRTWWSAVRDRPFPREWEWHKQAMEMGMAAADVVIAPSEAFAATLRRTYGPLPHLQVVRNGARAVEPGAKDKIVLSAGRWWDEGKNLGVLDSAAFDSKWPILVAGPLRGPNEATVMPQSLQWVGDLPHHEMQTWYSRAPIFVSTSIYEPFGLAVAEAANAGAALVLADIPTFRELWSYAAILVDPLDPARVAEAINLLVKDEPLRRRLAVAARARARSYSIARQVDGLAAAYSAAVSAHSMAA